LTATQGRSFGLTVGCAFIAIAVFLAWRGNFKSCAVAGVLGVALVIAAWALPARLDPVERAWMAVARAISTVTTPMVMSIMYFGVIMPIGLTRRWFGSNPLVHGKVANSYWKHRPEGARRTGSMKRQF
jgi:hypothetical protein